MDQTSQQLSAMTRRPIDPASGLPRRVDYEYERNGEDFKVYHVLKVPAVR